jgi:hypothetical protein
MRFLKTAAVTGVVIAAVVVLALEPASGAGPESNVADCSKAMLGRGPAGWRGEAAVAGPVAVLKVGLAHMTRSAGGDFVAKLPLSVEGTDPVTVSVPYRLRERVFLYYGRVIGRDGKPTTSFFDARGYGETEFRPCPGKPRTIWPGGLRIRGTAPVRLLVYRDGDAAPLPLRLGRPRAHEPRS